MRAGHQRAAPLSSSGGTLRRGCSSSHVCQGLPAQHVKLAGRRRPAGYHAAAWWQLRAAWHGQCPPPPWPCDASPPSRCRCSSLQESEGSWSRGKDEAACGAGRPASKTATAAATCKAWRLHCCNSSLASPLPEELVQLGELRSRGGAGQGQQQVGRRCGQHFSGSSGSKLDKLPFD